MMKNFILFLLVSFSLTIYAQISRTEYIEKYKSIAIYEMNRTGIPASITLAQGMLESGNGNSMLAKKANNHFGIKCHSSWKGPKVHKDDDKKNECFRKYRNAEKSYIDHSNFLVKYSRYEFLFKLKKTDYKGWAKGLKKAGYATNPKYPKLIIKIIEDNNLVQYDTYNSAAQQNMLAEYDEKTEDLKLDNTNSQPVYVLKKRPKPVEDYEFQIGYDIYENNNVKYIIAKKGDTFKKLTKIFEKMRWELPKYNELEKKAKLVQGQIIYLQPKRGKAEKEKEYHKVKKGESLYSISQKYAVKENKLLKKNNFPKNHKVNVGDKIWLRKNKK